MDLETIGPHSKSRLVCYLASTGITSVAQERVHETETSKKMDDRSTELCKSLCSMYLYYAEDNFI